MDKRIWMLWFQGFDKAPPIVMRCVKTWQQHNPEWELVLLDQSNIYQYVDVSPVIAKNRAIISPQAHANVIRINLLKKFGGVWADTTLFCMKPLDSWIHSVTESGFFAFRNPGPDRIMSNWFMSSHTDCNLTTVLCQVVNSFWGDRKFNENPGPMLKLIKAHLVSYSSKNVNRTRIWFHPLIRDVLKIYPYFWFHYLFYDTCQKDPGFARIWDSTPVLQASGPLAVHQRTYLKSKEDQIDWPPPPFYKLSWRFIEKRGIPSGSPLDNLLSISS